MEMEHTNNWVKDVATLAAHFTFCTTVALAVTLYEGYDCSYLKPQSSTIRNYPAYLQTSALNIPAEISVDAYDHNNPSMIQLMNRATRGMGRGAIDRSDGWYQDTYLTSRDSTMVQQDTYTERNVPSYNEIMLQHRTKTVPLWKERETITSQNVADAVESIVRALEIVQQLKIDSVDYEWDQMLLTLRDPALTTDLQYGCSTLQRATDYLSMDVRREVGFDWGSCAWRHCGAQADAQESLAELYNSIGLFEPFECQFVLDIVERSLRDMLAVMPPKFMPPGWSVRVGEYVPYEATNVNGGGDVDEDGLDSSEREFLNALAAVRNLSNDDEE